MISSSSTEHQQHRRALVAHGDDLLVDELDGADIDAAGRLADQQHFRHALPSRAPGSASAGCRRRTWRASSWGSGGRTSKASIILPQSRAAALVLMIEAEAIGAVAVIAEDCGFSQAGNAGDETQRAAGLPAHGRRRGGASVSGESGFSAETSRAEHMS